MILTWLKITLKFYCAFINSKSHNATCFNSVLTTTELSLCILNITYDLTNIHELYGLPAETHEVRLEMLYLLV